MNRLCLISFVFVFLTLATPVAAHNTSHNYTIVDNGVIEYGREAEAGGCVVWLSELAGPNLINNHDLGRQCQIAIFDTGDWNPTQAGDGGNPSGYEIFVVKPDYIYSRCIPLLFWNGPQQGEARPVYDQRIDMWSEFLPNSNGRAIWVRSMFLNWSGHEGICQGQQLSPCIYTNPVFTKNKAYTGALPWTFGPLSTFTDTGGDTTSVRFRATEHWNANVDDSDYGVASLSESPMASHMNYTASGGSGDHINACMTTNRVERFRIARNPGERIQIREGGDIIYLGDVNDARSIFYQYRPVPGADFSDNFNDGDFLGWDSNSNPIQVIGGAVKMGPFSQWPQDLSLAHRYYRDATFSVDVKHESGGTNWYGMTIRKCGNPHFWDGYQGYYMIHLRSNGTLSVYSHDDGTLAQTVIRPFDALQWHTLSVNAAGYRLRVSVDGVERLDVTDANEKFREGYVSLVAGQDLTVWFDNFSVTDSDGDSAPPGPVTGFSVSPTADNTRLQLSWTNPADEDWKFTRIVRKSGSRPRNPWDGFACYEGKLSSYTDVALVPGIHYFYAAYAYDRAYNFAQPAAADAAPQGAISAVLRVTDLVGTMKAVWTDTGQLLLRGDLIQQAGAEDLESTGFAEFLLKDASGQTVARLHSATGNLYLKGTVAENQTGLNNPLESALVFKDSAGDIVGYIDSNGNMALAGDVHYGYHGPW